MSGFTDYEGINQRNLKFWADLANKIFFGHTYKFWIWIFETHIMSNFGHTDVLPIHKTTWKSFL